MYVKLEEVNSISNLAVTYTHVHAKIKKNLSLMMFKNNYTPNTDICCKGIFFAE